MNLETLVLLAIAVILCIFLFRILKFVLKITLFAAAALVLLKIFGII